jgi:hypothetical protein
MRDYSGKNYRRGRWLRSAIRFVCGLIYSPRVTPVRFHVKRGADGLDYIQPIPGRWALHGEDR